MFPFNNPSSDHVDEILSRYREPLWKSGPCQRCKELEALLREALPHVEEQVQMWDAFDRHKPLPEEAQSRVPALAGAANDLVQRMCKALGEKGRE